MKLPTFKLPNRQSVISTASSLTEKGLVLMVIIYISISIGRSVMKNYQINQEIEGLKKELTLLDQQKRYLASLNEYYKTDTYKELKAREELGLQLPGETVVAVPIENDDQSQSIAAYATPEQIEEDRPLPNYRKWYDYFFSN